MSNLIGRFGHSPNPSDAGQCGGLGLAVSAISLFLSSTRGRQHPCHVANVGVQAERGLCGELAAGSEATEAGRKTIEAR